jgi:hypothetical protein
MNLFRKSVAGAHRLAALLVLSAVALLSAPLANAQALSDYYENKAVDVFVRAQSFTPPATHYYALATGTGSDTACGTEVSGGSYARVAVTASLTNYAGTQSAGSTSASSGTGGVTSNNIAINFPTPSAGWGTVVEYCVFDASSGGNLLWRAALTTSKTINSGDTVSFAIAAATLTIGMYPLGGDVYADLRLRWVPEAANAPRFAKRA